MANAVENHISLLEIVSGLLGTMNEISLLKPDEFEFGPELATNAILKANRAVRKLSRGEV